MPRLSLRRSAFVGALTVFLAGSLGANAQGTNVGAVRAIQHGLTVQPQSKPPGQGKTGQKLFVADQLQTKVKERALLGFNDATKLYMNQRTVLVLAAPRLIRLGRGEVSPVDVPGSHLQVQTSNAISSAIGTDFDVWIQPKPGPYGGVPKGYRGDQNNGPPGTTTVSVVSGLVRVSSHYGSVLVHAGQWTHVRPGQPPTTPNGHNVQQDIAWTAGLP